MGDGMEWEMGWDERGDGMGREMGWDGSSSPIWDIPSRI